MVNNYDWVRLRLKDKKPWWWCLLHPIKNRRANRWRQEAEKLLKIELEKMNFNKLIEQMLVDQMCYGTSVMLNGKLIAPEVMIDYTKYSNDIVQSYLERTEKSS